MQIYTPFLKFKQNEVAALADFYKSNDDIAIPFFDVPRPQENDAANIINRINTGIKQVDRNLKDYEFYIDNYDLDDSIELLGLGQYEYILQGVSHLNVIPVVAFNRHHAHNKYALKHVSSKGCKVAVRLNQEDIESYKLTRTSLLNLWKEITIANPNEIHLIIDFRVITSELTALKNIAVNFINSFCSEFNVDRIIVTGSSIPAVITSILKPNSSKIIDRFEWHLYQDISPALSKIISNKLIYGDYGLISPDYSDTELEFWLMQTVASPKAFYTFSTNFFVLRGGAFKTHPDGYRQYFTMADSIVSMKFFRGEKYSSGDKYIFDRSSKTTTKISKGGSPSSWLKATLSSHLKYIVDSL